MSDFDERVRGALGRRVRGVDEQPDWDDLSDRLVRRDRKRSRALVGALVISLFAGPALGFVAGRGGTGDNDGVRAVARGGDGVEVGDVGAPPVLSGGPGAPAVGGATGFLGPDGAALESGRWVAYSPGWGGGFSEPMARLFVRDEGATRIRAYRAAVEPYDDGIPWWDAPAYCLQSGWIQADVSTEYAVAIASGSTFGALRDGAVVAQLTPMGFAEGEPTWVVVAQAPAGAATVRATFPGGATDQMKPVDGVAVLVARAPEGANQEELWQASVTVDALDGAGNVVATGDTVTFFDYSSEECNPPPEPLPEPGEEQPADPAAARAEIEGLYGKRWSEQTDEERLANLDDPRGIQQVYDELVTGPFAEAVKSARSVLRDVVFLSATRAAVRYDTEVEGYPPGSFSGMFAEVVFVDGRWKLTREGFCTQIRLAGATCPPV